MGKERGELLKKEIGIGKKVLDIGCRDGSLTKYFVAGNNVLGVDIDELSLEKAKINLKINTRLLDLNGDWNELGGEKFDVIVAGEVLEHLYCPEEVFKKIINHLNPQGIFLGSVPNAFSLKNRVRYLLGKKKNTPLEDPTHINHFGYNDLNNLFKKYFKEVKIFGLGRYKKLSEICPLWFAFNLFFKVKI